MRKATPGTAGSRNGGEGDDRLHFADAGGAEQEHAALRTVVGIQPEFAAAEEVIGTFIF